MDVLVNCVFYIRDQFRNFLFLKFPLKDSILTLDHIKLLFVVHLVENKKYQVVVESLISELD